MNKRPTLTELNNAARTLAYESIARARWTVGCTPGSTTMRRQRDAAVLELAMVAAHSSVDCAIVRQLRLEAKAKMRSQQK